MNDYLDIATTLARDAGEIMRKNFTLQMKKEWKEDHSPVTETDLAINEHVLKTIKSKYPDHSILAEEGDDFSEEHEYVWICDPVDGTHNFSHGIPTATFALALTHRGDPVLSVVYDPFMDRLYRAEKGKGAYLNDVTIHITETPNLKRTVIGMGKLSGVCDLLAFYRMAHPHGIRFITGLSTHYMAAMVAAGEFTAALFGGTSPHDITASTLLVREANGVATDLFGKTPERYDRDMDGQLCSNGAVHNELLAILESVNNR